jgi:hypothetical protein
VGAEDSSRRFGDLYNLVHDPAFLVDAFERVARNKGSKTSGVDGWTVARVRSQIGVEEFLSHMSSSGFDGGFQLPLSRLLGEGVASVLDLELDRRDEADLAV